GGPAARNPSVVGGGRGVRVARRRRRRGNRARGARAAAGEERGVIEVTGLVKRYGDVTAVDDLSFEVAAGETFAIVGPNGAGKTTTLKLLLGLVHPDRGRIALGPER